MPEASQLVAPVPTLDQNVADSSEADVLETTEAGGADTTEQVAETDEQKNERELADTRERSEKRARGVQKRLDELTADKYAERAAREAAERRFDQLNQQLQQREMARQAQAGNGEPKREGFADYEQYLEARTAWRAEQIVAQRLQQAEQTFAVRQQQEQQARALEAMQQTLATRLTEYAKKDPELTDAISAHDEEVPVPAALAVMRHPDAGPLMKFMGRNPQFVTSLQRMDQFEQVTAIGELAAKLRTTPQVSKAPAPGTPVGPRGSTNKDVRSMTADEYYDHITKGRRGKK